jgi:hypothetical protein
MPNLILNPDDRQQLEQIAADQSSESLYRRAQLLLLYDQGYPTQQVAREVGLCEGKALLAPPVRVEGMGSSPAGFCAWDSQDDEPKPSPRIAAPRKNP